MVKANCKKGKRHLQGRCRTVYKRKSGKCYYQKPKRGGRKTTGCTSRAAVKVKGVKWVSHKSGREVQVWENKRGQFYWYTNASGLRRRKYLNKRVRR